LLFNFTKEIAMPHLPIEIDGTGSIAINVPVVDGAHPGIKAKVFDDAKDVINEPGHDTVLMNRFHDATARIYLVEIYSAPGAVPSKFVPNDKCLVKIYYASGGEAPPKVNGPTTAI
jgi:hypothetical protein